MAGNERPDGSTTRNVGREVALNVGATLGLLCIVAALASLFFGVKPLVFRSGSMSPAIHTGALALSKTVPADELAVGDIVSVVNNQGTRITHRVAALEPSNGGVVLVTLKGDANKQPDLAPYPVTEADRVFFHVNGLGYVAAWLSSPLAIFLGGGLVGALIVLAFGGKKSTHEEGDHPNVRTTSIDEDRSGELQEAHHG